MKRTIVQPATLTGPPLADCKEWLGITRPNEDAEIVTLLHASMDLCEAFTGQMPLEVTCEEVLPANLNWQSLSTRPIRAILEVKSLSQSGDEAPLPIADYDIDLDAEGKGLVRLSKPTDHSRVVVRFVAGIAQDWADLPDALRHGIIRLAAHHYRDRDATQSLAPPASVAALWRPWRALRLA